MRQSVLPQILLMLAGLGAYAAILFLTPIILAHGVEEETPRLALSLLPMLPVIFICWLIMRNIRSLDELQRKLQIEALALAFAGTALLTFSYGFLEGAGLPKMTMFAVLPLMCTLWVLGVILGNVRYR